MVWRIAPRWTLANAALVVVQGGLPLAALFVMRRIVDAVAASLASTGQAAPGASVFLWVGVAGGVALLTALARSLGEYATEGQALRVTDEVADILHAQSVAVDLEYYEDPAYHDTLHRAQREAPYRPTRIVNGLVQAGQSGLAFAGLAGWLFASHWLLAAGLVVAAVPGVYGRLMHSRRIFGFDRAKTEHERRAWYYHTVLTDQAHAKELRLFDLGSLFQARHREARQHIRAGRLALAKRRVLFDLGAQTVATAALFVALAWIALQTTRGAFTLGDLVVCFVGFQSALSLLQTFMRALAGLYEDNLFLTNFYAFLDIVPAIAPPPRPRAVPTPIVNGVIVDKVGFRYPGQSADALHDVDLTLAPGEIVALVGENGSGKSTLLKLLCRLYDPARGAITVDGVDVRDLDPVQWRRRLSVVFQDYTHYALTVTENIWLGDTTTPPEPARIAQAGLRAGIDPAVRRLPSAYDTLLGRWFREGQELSEGEWQKIALARAFWRDARILVLDEPSSALDPLAEADLFRRFRDLLDGRSAVIVSHRFSTVQLADCIYVMDQGRVVERGTHAALVARGGHYARLYRAQAQYYRASGPE